jgi:hypothetical protein
MPVLNPEPEIVSCVMVMAADPELAILTVLLAEVLSTCDPKARLAGVAVTVAVPLGVLGVGVGFGELPVGELLAVPLVPPQPIAAKMESTRKRKRPA